MTRLETRLTRRLGITHPVLSAPMAGVSGGGLAAAVSAAGGLGLIGGGYGDRAFLETAYREAGNARTGAGFITWSLAQKPDLLDLVLDHRPVAVMLSFGEPALFADRIRAAGALLICQCQTLAHVDAAIDAGAAIIVAQGGEAGGHGGFRGTLPFVPEAADRLARRAPDVLLLAAGGIAEGRGLAAALMLGADGVLVGSRFWATPDARSHASQRARAIAATGDETLKTASIDVVRKLDWPPGFAIRVGKNAFTQRWHGNEEALAADIDRQAEAFGQAMATGDADAGALIFGEAAGLIGDDAPAGVVLARMVEDAAACLGRAGTFVVEG